MASGNVTTIDSEAAALYDFHRAGLQDAGLYALCRCAVLTKVYGCRWPAETTARLDRLREKSDLVGFMGRAWDK